MSAFLTLSNLFSKQPKSPPQRAPPQQDPPPQANNANNVKKTPKSTIYVYRTCPAHDRLLDNVSSYCSMTVKFADSDLLFQRLTRPSLIYFESYKGAIANSYDRHNRRDDRNAVLCKIVPLTQLCKKADFAQALFLWSDKGDVANVGHPPTLILPAEIGKVRRFMQEQGKGCAYVLKPSSGVCGRDIVLLPAGTPPEAVVRQSNPYNLHSHDANKIVLQKYLENIVLCRGRKFDLRLYMLVVLPPAGEARVFLCHLGFGRLSRNPYAPLNESGHLSDKERSFVHLTNFSINKLKKGEEEQENMELKIELWVLLAELEKEGAIGSKRKVWKAIKNLCQSLGKVLVNAPPMRSRRERGVRYHVMGVDIMLLQDDAVSLIEVNSSPALSVGADDEDIKTRMYGEAVKIVMAVCRGEEEAAAAVAEARKKRVWQELAMKRADKDDWRSWGGGSKEAGGRKQQHCIIL